MSDIETSKRKVGAEHAARDKIQTLMNWGVISEHDKRIARKCQTPSSQTSADQEELSVEENVLGGGVFSHSKAAVSAETESVVTKYLHSTGSFYGKEDHSFDSDSSNTSAISTDLPSLVAGAHSLVQISAEGLFVSPETLTLSNSANNRIIFNTLSSSDVTSSLIPDSLQILPADNVSRLPSVAEDATAAFHYTESPYALKKNRGYQMGSFDESEEHNYKLVESDEKNCERSQQVEQDTSASEVMTASHSEDSATHSPASECFLEVRDGVDISSEQLSQLKQSLKLTYAVSLDAEYLSLSSASKKDGEFIHEEPASHSVSLLDTRPVESITSGNKSSSAEPVDVGETEESLDHVTVHSESEVDPGELDVRFQGHIKDNEALSIKTEGSRKTDQEICNNKTHIGPGTSHRKQQVVEESKKAVSRETEGNEEREDGQWSTAEQLPQEVTAKNMSIELNANKDERQCQEKVVEMLQTDAQNTEERLSRMVPETVQTKIVTEIEDVKHVKNECREVLQTHVDNINGTNQTVDKEPSTVRKVNVVATDFNASGSSKDRRRQNKITSANILETEKSAEGMWVPGQLKTEHAGDNSEDARHSRVIPYIWDDTGGHLVAEELPTLVKTETAKPDTTGKQSFTKSESAEPSPESEGLGDKKEVRQGPEQSNDSEGELSFKREETLDESPDVIFMQQAVTIMSGPNVVIPVASCTPKDVGNERYSGETTNQGRTGEISYKLEEVDSEKARAQLHVLRQSMKDLSEPAKETPNGLLSSSNQQTSWMSEPGDADSDAGSQSVHELYPPEHKQFTVPQRFGIMNELEKLRHEHSLMMQLLEKSRNTTPFPDQSLQQSHSTCPYEMQPDLNLPGHVSPVTSSMGQMPIKRYHEDASGSLMLPAVYSQETKILNTDTLQDQERLLSDEEIESLRDRTTTAIGALESPLLSSDRPHKQGIVSAFGLSSQAGFSDVPEVSKSQSTEAKKEDSRDHSIISCDDEDHVTGIAEQNLNTESGHGFLTSSDQQRISVTDQQDPLKPADSEILVGHQGGQPQLSGFDTIDSKHSCKMPGASAFMQENSRPQGDISVASSRVQCPTDIPFQSDSQASKLNKSYYMTGNSLRNVPAIDNFISSDLKADQQCFGRYGFHHHLDMSLSHVSTGIEAAVDISDDFTQTATEDFDQNGILLNPLDRYKDSHASAEQSETRKIQTELDRLQQERIEIIELLSLQYLPASLTVEILEAKLNYCIGQTDLLLASLEDAWAQEEADHYSGPTSADNDYLILYKHQFEQSRHDLQVCMEEARRFNNGSRGRRMARTRDIIAKKRQAEIEAFKLERCREQALLERARKLTSESSPERSPDLTSQSSITSSQIFTPTCMTPRQHQEHLVQLRRSLVAASSGELLELRRRSSPGRSYSPSPDYSTSSRFTSVDHFPLNSSSDSFSTGHSTTPVPKLAHSSVTQRIPRLYVSESDIGYRRGESLPRVSHSHHPKTFHRSSSSDPPGFPRETFHEGTLLKEFYSSHYPSSVYDDEDLDPERLLAESYIARQLNQEQITKAKEALRLLDAHCNKHQSHIRQTR